MKQGNVKITVILLLFSALFLFCGNHIASSHSLTATVSEYESELDEQVFARVTAIDSVQPNPDDSSADIVTFTCVITSENGKGTVVKATQYAYKNNSTMPPAVKVNDKVVLGKLSAGKKAEYAFENYDRIGQISLLSLAFIGLVLLFGGKKGIKIILSLGLTCLAIFYVFIPCIIAGFNIYGSTILVCVYIIGISFALTGGLNKKSVAAAIGCTGGVVFSSIIYLLMEALMKITGYYNNETSRLNQIFAQNPLDLKALVFAMVTIGAIGATMDVAMSIASPLDEIENSRAHVKKTELLKSGLNIGKDIMGTMTNTLILAYIGSGLVTVLIYAASNYPLLQLLNKEEIIIEFLQSLIGSLGMLFTIPSTAIVSAFLFSKNTQPHKDKPAVPNPKIKNDRLIQHIPQGKAVRK